MRPLAILATFLLFVGLQAGASVRSTGAGKDLRLEIATKAEALSTVIESIAAHLGEPVFLQADDRRVDFSRSGVTPLSALAALATQEGLWLARAEGGWTVSDPAERTLSLDVKDGEVRAILREVKRQCGIRNLIVDPEVQGRGTFLFRDVPCAVGIRVILSTLGLDYEIDAAVMRVADR